MSARRAATIMRTPCPVPSALALLIIRSSSPAEGYFPRLERLLGVSAADCALCLNPVVAVLPCGFLSALRWMRRASSGVIFRRVEPASFVLT
ncbi:hypothetical protein [Microbispora rosea]|uniref:hypothetical protein n=1 Tax=Microbispora rosea TaxID=58117 RepID=UPI001356300A|nr:hypothetical protein [Microbispora rosea]